MDKHQAALDIITATLPHVPFDGWTMRALRAGAKDAGYQSADAIRVFPEGATQAVDRFLTMGDEALKSSLTHYHLDSMKIRERIILAVRSRIEYHAHHEEALRRAMALYTLPVYLPRALHSLYRTVDSIWHAIGDTSTDFNFYSKRATLAAVYMACLHFWINDKSLGKQASWDFLHRRIEDVMKVEKLKAKLRQFVS